MLRGQKRHPQVNGKTNFIEYKPLLQWPVGAAVAHQSYTATVRNVNKNRFLKKWLQSFLFIVKHVWFAQKTRITQQEVKSVNVCLYEVRMKEVQQDTKVSDLYSFFTHKALNKQWYTVTKSAHRFYQNSVVIIRQEVRSWRLPD